MGTILRWDEIGRYDLPAAINYVLTTTGQAKLSYIGHSLGSGSFFIAMITHPELNSKIEIMVFHYKRAANSTDDSIFFRVVGWFGTAFRVYSFPFHFKGSLSFPKDASG